MTGHCDGPPMTSIHTHTTLDGAALIVHQLSAQAWD